MKGKWSKCYLLIGTIVILIIVAIGSLAFVKGNITQADNKYNFESIYLNTDIYFIIPSPSYEQVSELDNSSDIGIGTVTPFYETSTSVTNKGVICTGTTVILPDEVKVANTPYTDKRILRGSVPKADQAIIDQLFYEKNNCDIGDTIEISIADKNLSFEIVGVSETNTYCKDGSIALVLNKNDAATFLNEGIGFSAAYVKASDYDKCKTYLYSEYKPFGRLKDQSEFTSEDTYNQHVNNFEDADWTKEITDCDANYDSLKIKYENVEKSMFINLIIYAAIIILMIVVMNITFMKGSDIQKAIKINIVKNGGTVEDAKKFYSSGIRLNFVEFLILSGAAYYIVASRSIKGLFGMQLVNIVIPVVTALVGSIFMTIVTAIYAGQKYKLRKSEVIDIKRELGIPLNESEKSEND